MVDEGVVFHEAHDNRAGHALKALRPGAPPDN
jgi:hypothetical protein